MAVTQIPKSAIKMMGGKKMMLDNGRWKEAAKTVDKLRMQIEEGKKKNRTLSPQALSQRKDRLEAMKKVLEGKKPKMAKPTKDAMARGRAKDRVKAETQVTKDAYAQKEKDLKKQAKTDMTKAKIASGAQKVAKLSLPMTVPNAKVKSVAQKLKGRKLTKDQRAKALAAMAGAMAGGMKK